MLRAAIVVLCVACTKPPAAPESSCLDRELSARHLNEYGDREGTMYPGGTPLFNERTGQRTDRAEYVFSRHPDIAQACGKSGDAGP